MVEVSLACFFVLISGVSARTTRRFPLQRVERPDTARHALQWHWPGPVDTSVQADVDGEQAQAPPVVNLIEARRTFENTNDLFYTLAVSIGTPPKVAQLQVDTGSSVLWVDQAKVAGVEKSTTAGNRGFKVDFSYARGHVSGMAYTDRVCLTEDASARAGSYPLCVEQQPYVVVDDLTDLPSTNAFQGIIGLGNPNLWDRVLGYESPGETFMQELNRTNFATHLSFGISLTRAPSTSFIAFGDFEDIIKDAPPDSAGAAVTLPLFRFGPGEDTYWMIMSSVAIGSGELYKERNTTVCLDSGASLIVAPQLASHYLEMVASMLSKGFQHEYVGQVKAMLEQEVDAYETIFGAMVRHLSDQQCSMRKDAGGHIFCLCDVELQPLTFSFVGEGGKTLAITLSSDDLLSPMGETEDGQKICRLGLQRGPVGIWTLGTVFLRRAYVVHDVQRLKVTLFPAASAEASNASLDNSTTEASLSARIAATRIDTDEASEKSSAVPAETTSNVIVNAVIVVLLVSGVVLSFRRNGFSVSRTSREPLMAAWKAGSC